MLVMYLSLLLLFSQEKLSEELDNQRRLVESLELQLHEANG